MSDPQQSDLRLYFAAHYSAQGELVVADVAGRAIRLISSPELRRVWVFNDRIINQTITEKECTATFVKAFLSAYGRANR